MSLAPVLRQSVKLNPAGWRPGAATRCALVLAVVLLGGSLCGHPAWGVAAAIGAFNAGLASLGGVYRTRLRTMLQICGVSFVCALIGGLVGPSLPWAVLTLTAGCLLFTVYGEAVPAASTLTLQATMTLLILSGLRLPPSAVPGTALLVLLGGAAQVLVLGVLWPLGRHQPEHRAVSLAYAALADFVGDWEGPQPAPGALFPDDAPFQGALAALGSVPPSRRRPGHARLQDLLEEAEGLRAALISLGLQPWVRTPEEPARLLRRVLARTLTRVRRNVRQGHTGPDLRGREGPVTPGALRALRRAARRAAPAGELDQAASPLALTLELFGRLGQPDRPPADPVLPHAPPLAPAAATLPFWRLRPTPAQWQHGLRLALAVGLSDLLVRLLALPHGYWLPLTVGLVLRADYLTTLTRGAARLLGTLAAVLAGLLIGLAHPSAGLDTLFVLVSAWLAYALLQVGYAPFSAAVSLYVITSVSASGLSQGAVAEGRLVYTVLGALVALLAFLVWPLWVSGTAGERLRQAAIRQLAYADALLEYGRASDKAARAGPLEDARGAARSARVQAEGVVTAAAAEPAWAAGGAGREAAVRDMALLSANAARLVALQLALRGRRGDASPGLRAALREAREVSARLAV